MNVYLYEILDRLTVKCRCIIQKIVKVLHKKRRAAAAMLNSTELWFAFPYTAKYYAVTLLHHFFFLQQAQWPLLHLEMAEVIFSLDLHMAL